MLFRSRLFAFFNNVLEYGEDGRVANAVPLMTTPTTQQQAQLADMDRRLDALARELRATDKTLALSGEAEKALRAEDEKLGARLAKTAPPDAKKPGRAFAAKEIDLDPKRGTTLSLWFRAGAGNPADAPLLVALDRGGNVAGVGYGSGRELRLVDGELEWAVSQRYPTYASIDRKSTRLNSSHSSVSRMPSSA